MSQRMVEDENLVYRLRKRAEIRRSDLSRKSVLAGEVDRIADLLEEAAAEIERLQGVSEAAQQIIYGR